MLVNAVGFITYVHDTFINLLVIGASAVSYGAAAKAEPAGSQPRRIHAQHQAAERRVYAPAVTQRVWYV